MLRFLVVLLLWVSEAQALTTVVCPGHADCQGDDYIVPTGETRSDIIFKLDGSLIPEGGAIIRHSQVICRGNTERHGVRIENVDFVTLEDVDVSGTCGKGGHAGIYVHGEHVVLSNGKVRSSDGYGVRVVNASDVSILGWWVTTPIRDGISIEGTLAFLVADSLVYEGTDVTSVGVRIRNSIGGLVRSRSRYSGGETDIDALSLVFQTGNECETEVGQAVCIPGRYGPEANIWTVCPVLPSGAAPSYADEIRPCDFETIDAALASVLVTDGAIISVDDYLGSQPWPALTIDKSVTLQSATCGGNLGGKLCSAAMKGTYGYFNKAAGATVTAPGVRLLGFDFLSPVNGLADTVVLEKQ